MYDVSIRLKMSHSLSLTSRMAQFSSKCLKVSKGVPLEIGEITAIVGNRRIQYIDINLFPMRSEVNE